MRTMYLRNVPDEVAEGLEQLAARAGMSLNAFAVRELREVARRAANAELLDALPDVAIDVDVIVDALDDARADH